MHDRAHRYPRSDDAGPTGFTIAELIIGVLVIGSLLAVALPPMGSAMRDMRLDAATERLAGDLFLARIEAVKRNRNVHVAVTGSRSYEIEFVGSRVLAEDIEFGSGTTDTLRFAPFGLTVTGAATYVLALGSATRTISVTAAGFPDVD